MLSFEMIQVSRGKAYDSLKETLKYIRIIENRLNNLSLSFRFRNLFHKGLKEDSTSCNFLL